MDRLVRTFPLTCPFCDEPADQIVRSHRKITAHKIYTKRQCTMGHVVWSVEEIPEDQSAVVEELKTINETRRDDKLGLREQAASQTDI